MLDNYLIVHKDALPDYFDKVIEARHYLEEGKAKDVSAAVRMAGISRSTYYKYKDLIMEPGEMNSGRMAVISVRLSHEPGVLSAVLSKVSEAGGSVVTITQSMPVHNRAEVLISLDAAGMNDSVEELIGKLTRTTGVEKAKLLALE